MSDKFTITKKENEKLFDIVVQGKFEKEDGQAYMTDFTQKISSINPSDYTLKFDCRNLSVSANESLDLLQGCFNLYKETGFKKVIAVLDSNQIVLEMQFKRLARNANLDNFEIIK